MSILAVFPDRRWWRVVDGEIATRGLDVADALPPAEGERVVTVMPMHDTLVTTLALPASTDAQALGAARMAIADVSLTPIAALHLAVGSASAADGTLRPVVSVEAARVTEELLTLAAIGLDPDDLVPAALLLPWPESGWVRASVAGETIVRGTSSAFTDDPFMTPALTSDADIITLDEDTTSRAMLDAIVAPPANLRSGPFAKRRAMSIDVARLRRLAVLALVLGLIVLANQLVLIGRIEGRAAKLEREAATLTAAILPPGSAVTSPAVQAEARAASLGGGASFATATTAVVSAVESTPGADVGSTSFDAGALRVTVRAANAADLAAVEARLRAAGPVVTPGAVVASGGRPYREFMVRP